MPLRSMLRNKGLQIYLLPLMRKETGHCDSRFGWDIPRLRVRSHKLPRKLLQPCLCFRSSSRNDCSETDSGGMLDCYGGQF